MGTPPSPSRRRRIVGLVAAFFLVVLVIVGVAAWQRIAPALGWTSPVVDTVPPALPAGLERAPLAILEFSKTSGFRHREAIPAARASLEAIAKRKKSEDSKTRSGDEEHLTLANDLIGEHGITPPYPP